MATWLHDVEIYASLAEADAGPARDWGTARLALYAPDRFRVFPDDERTHDVVLAAAPPRVVEAMIEAIRTRSPLSGGLANAAAALGPYGLLPDDPSDYVAALRGAIRKDGDEADLWGAYALALVGAATPASLAAAAKVKRIDSSWVLPIVLLSVAEPAGALTEAATSVAREIHAAAADPHRLFLILLGLGLPIGTLARPYKDADEAVAIGAAMAHQHAPVVKTKPGSARRRQQQLVDALTTGVPGAAAALLRAVYATGESRTEWGQWPVAVASWLNARARPSDHGHGDDLHDVLHHGGGGDPKRLAALRREVGPAQADDLRHVLHHHADIPAGLLAATVLRQLGHDQPLADGLLRMHGGDLDADVRTTALAVIGAAAWPDRVPALLRSASTDDRALGLVVAEWVPTTEVLEALLAMPVPADPMLRLQFARDLAAMADPAALPVLGALKAADRDDALGEAFALAELLLHQPVPTAEG